MKHNLHGDVSSKDLEFANKLLEMEEWFDCNGSAHESAKVFICLSYDWYCLGDDDKGHNLLIKAEKVCPGYFDNRLAKDVEGDDMYRVLVENLTEQILLIARSLMSGEE